MLHKVKKCKIIEAEKCLEVYPDDPATYCPNLMAWSLFTISCA